MLAKARPDLLLRELLELKARFGGGVEERKRELLLRLADARFRTARQVERFHEALCFLRAYPDSAEVLRLVERQLRAFASRPDLRRHRTELADTGIAGTEIRYPFFHFTAQWLARRFPDRIRIDWMRFARRRELERLLHLLVLYSETPSLDEYALSVKEWLDRLRGPSVTDAAFLVRRFRALRLDSFARETLFESLDVPIRLAPGPATPSRTRAKHRGLPLAYPASPLVRARPSLRAEVRRSPLAVREAPPREARHLIDLAREAMVTRARDLDVFAHGDVRDVRLVDCGEGLQFAVIGAVPERRLLLEAVYGMLTLRNGVPVGYVLASALYSSSEIAYNVFETYRGAEAAAIYGRVIATVRHLFGSDCFTIYPYQLGHDNDEALRSGAFWFYRKLGFRPRDPGIRRILRREEQALRSDPAHRSSRETLEALAADNVYWSLGRERADVIGRLPLPNVGLRVSDYVARRFGADRERAERVCAREAAALLGLASLDDLEAGERLAFKRWAPLVLVLPGLGRWRRRDRRALLQVVRAKGGQRESDFVLLFDRHWPLRRALRTLVAGEP